MNESEIYKCCWTLDSPSFWSHVS